MNDSHLFKLARKASFKSTYNGSSNAQIGTVVVYKGSVLAVGSNSDITHTLQHKFNRYRFNDDGPNYLPAKIHSELQALNKIKYLDIDFSKAHVYNYRETRDGHIALSRPCEACTAAIKAMGIQHIHYTTNENSYVHEVFKP